MQLKSTLTCPRCAHQAIETMPNDACQFFYDCKGYGERLKPKQGDCCVFCTALCHVRRYRQGSAADFAIFPASLTLQ